MTYETPAALRAALEDRLQNESRNRSIDLGRLRRRAVFERILVRLESQQPGRWVVKGAIALEVRLKERARATKDLDLAIREDVKTGDEVRDLIIEGLAVDVDGDGFSFEVSPPRDITAEMGGRPGWRFSIEASLAGKLFGQVRLDVVARPDEVTETERVLLPGSMSFAGFPTREVEVVAPTQHFAEKLHALTRSYGDRENSRVRDLADLVLLIEDGFDDLSSVLAAARRVFHDRNTHDVPVEIPDPPASWTHVYAAMAEELDISAPTVDDAMQIVRNFWNQVGRAHPKSEVDDAQIS